ncbi:Hsp20/alpha crystallin family protein, partial [Inquilinus sp. OTU3971]|uniref:Hsp20/alpha crystallin family protein n=1 Tax=Inquilinus sp. OTU3971 TaxID=3043855 RepID=UPI00313A8D3F
LAALPGVEAERAEVAVKGNALLISGQRTLPPEIRTAVIHRLELPRGRFERRISLPSDRYSVAQVSWALGCIAIVLRKPA